ncbi:MAG TPA: SPOR domain-containing protein [Chitinophagaceae bacterium]|jgi:hypothetical protein
MQKLLLFTLLGCFSLGAYAQADSTSSIVIHKDPRIDLLVKKQAQVNEETTRDARRNIPGFRIQVINTSDRNAAISAKTKVYQLYPELKAYLIYQSPYFRLRVGNFKDRDEADDYLKALSRQFPGNVFLVRDVVEIRPSDSN